MDLLLNSPGPQSPGELYLAFGPDHRVVKARSAEGATQFLAHVTRGPDRLWRLDCEPVPFVEDADGSSLYGALRSLVDRCPTLAELEP
jgi:hypothetical protein